MKKDSKLRVTTQQEEIPKEKIEEKIKEKIIEKHSSTFGLKQPRVQVTYTELAKGTKSNKPFTFPNYNRMTDKVFKITSSKLIKHNKQGVEFMKRMEIKHGGLYTESAKETLVRKQIAAGYDCLIEFIK